MKNILCLVLVMFLTACVSKTETALRAGETGHLKAGASSALKIGMTRAEVEGLYGPAQRTASDGSSEILTYVEELPWWNWKTLKITLVDGKVTQYGQN